MGPEKDIYENSMVKNYLIKCKLVQGEKKETWFSSKLIKLYIIYAQEPLF